MLEWFPVRFNPCPAITALENIHHLGDLFGLEVLPPLKLNFDAVKGSRATPGPGRRVAQDLMRLRLRDSKPGRCLRGPTPLSKQNENPILRCHRLLRGRRIRVQFAVNPREWEEEERRLSTDRWKVLTDTARAPTIKNRFQ